MGSAANATTRQHATTRPAMKWDLLVALRTMAAKIARSFAQRQFDGGSSLRIEEKLSLGPKKTVFLVNCKGRQFLVATGADTVTQMVEVFSPRVNRTVAARFNRSAMAARKSRP